MPHFMCICSHVGGRWVVGGVGGGILCISESRLNKVCVQ